MVAHTGFLVVARRIAPDSTPLIPSRRPAPAAHSEPLGWEEEEVTERTISEKKLRKVLRDVAHRADVEASGSSEPGDREREMRELHAEQAEARQQERYAARRAAREARYQAAQDAAAANQGEAEPPSSETV